MGGGAPRPSAVFKGPTSKGREGKEEGGAWKERIKGREGERRWREVFGQPEKFGVTPAPCAKSIVVKS